VVFDLSLFGTWTWIPDEIFRRFDWPSSTNDARRNGDAGNSWLNPIFAEKTINL
jgi:hypothetical protein